MTSLARVIPIVIAALLASTSAARSELIKVAPLLALDTETGLEWVHLKHSDLLGHSYIGVVNGPLYAQGYRHATRSEVCDLFARYGTGCGVTERGHQGNSILFGALGTTGAVWTGKSRWATGRYDDGNPYPNVGLAGYRSVRGRRPTSSAYAADDRVAADERCANCIELKSHFVVRPAVTSTTVTITTTTTLLEPEICGDAIVAPSEECDDGNSLDGDCCSSACVAEPAGMACADDGNECTDNECDGSGACVAFSNAAPCDDGLFCNGPDTCDDGTCSLHAGDPCAPAACANDCDECTGSCLGLTAPECSISYDAADDFPATPPVIPNGAWTYGYLSGGLSGSYSDHPACWSPFRGNPNFYGCMHNAQVIKNYASSGQQEGAGGGLHLFGGELALVPSTTGPDVAVARWVAPFGGRDTISGEFGGRNNVVASDAGVHLLLNGVDAFGGRVSGFGTDGAVPFSTTVCLGAGDIIDFTADVGGPATNDAASVDATIATASAGAESAAGLSTLGTPVSVSTDSEQDGATAADPVESSVSSPSGGQLSLVERSAAAVPLLHFDVAGEIEVLGTVATAVDPVVTILELDASRLPPVALPGAVQVTDGAAAVQSCADGTGHANPDPCIAARTHQPDGDLEITVLSSSPATWTPVLHTAPCGAAPEPEESCKLTPEGRSSLLIKDDADDEKDAMKWKWKKGEMSDMADFMDPTSNSDVVYRVCLYDSSTRPQPLSIADIPPASTCDGVGCWKLAGTTSLKFKNKAAMFDGVSQVKLKAGAAGKAQVQVKMAGEPLAIPSLDPLTLPVTVQLIVGDATARNCWQAKFTTATKHETDLFKAKGP